MLTAFLMIFRPLSEDFRRFSKIVPKARQTFPNIFREFPKIPEDVGRFPKIAEDFRGRPEVVSMIHQGIQVQFKRQTWFTEIIDIFTCEDIISSHVRISYRFSFSSPEAALLLVSTKNHDLWPCPTTEVRDSQTSRHSAHALSQVWQIWLVLVSIYCVYKSIQNRNVVGAGQRSWFLVLTKRSAASGDENGARTQRKKFLSS